MTPYEQLQRRLARGWNTWNTRSVLSHVLLPEGLALNLGIKEYAGGSHLREALIGRFGAEDERITPGPRSYDGAYTELALAWRGVEVTVQSGLDGDDLLLLVTPRKLPGYKTPALIVEAGFLWNRPGWVEPRPEGLVARAGERSIPIFATQQPVTDAWISATGPYLALELAGPVGVSTGRARGVDEIRAKLEANRQAFVQSVQARYGALAEVYSATQTCLAWDTIFEPQKGRAVSTVSRLWNCGWGGYVIFDWDTYFAALMASLDNRDLACANAVEITRARTRSGFIPNFEGGTGKSEDRSQPPVGSMAVREIYRRWGDRWLLEEVYDDLLAWNRWWPANRATGGLLCWGSNPFEPIYGSHFELNTVGDSAAAALESGLDNSPMYDDVPYDPASHQMMLADIGLTGMYVMDCFALAEIAEILGKAADTAELRGRGEQFQSALKGLWDEQAGIFCNRRTDTGEFSHRLSPTNFYALLGRAASPQQAERMVAEHFYNPAEFWGEWIMPTIARNDPGYPDQHYWRGRIWAPTNFLVYLGLREYALAEPMRDLSEKSQALLLKEWREHGHVHENYNGDTGEGCDSRSSDKFYHWGGLLGLIALMQAGF